MTFLFVIVIVNSFGTFAFAALSGNTTLISYPLAHSLLSQHTAAVDACLPCQQCGRTSEIRYLDSCELDVVVVDFCPVLHQPFWQFDEPDFVFAPGDVEIWVQVVLELVY